MGFAQANNQAMSQAHGRYILLLNSDTEVHPGAFSVLIDFMERTSKAGAVGAYLLNADGTLQPACHPMLTPWREFLRLLFLDRFLHVATSGPTWWTTDVPRQTEVIKGACLMLRRTALEQVGLLDGSYFMYTEEVDLCYRLSQAGWQLWWVPAAKVTHFGEASSRQVAQTMYVQLYRSKSNSTVNMVVSNTPIGSKSCCAWPIGPAWPLPCCSLASPSLARRLTPIAICWPSCRVCDTADVCTTYKGRISMRICYVLLSPTFGMHQYTADLANRMILNGLDAQSPAAHEVFLVTTDNYPRSLCLRHHHSHPVSDT